MLGRGPVQNLYYFDYNWKFYWAKRNSMTKTKKHTHTIIRKNDAVFFTFYPLDVQLLFNQ